MRKLLYFVGLTMGYTGASYAGTFFGGPWVGLAFILGAPFVGYFGAQYAYREDD